MVGNKIMVPWYTGRSFVFIREGVFHQVPLELSLPVTK